MTFTRTDRFLQQISAVWKLCLSFRKKIWVLEDYPLAMRRQDTNPDYSPTRMRLKPYVASIVNWYLSGTGDTPEAAMSELRTHLETARTVNAKEGKPLPRPGARVPIVFSSRDLVYKHPELAEDFIRRILELDWAWISDESTLWEFHADETNEQLQAKIVEVYGVKVFDIESAKLHEILERIAESQVSGSSA